MMLEQHAKEALDAAEDGVMDHDRPNPAARGVDIAGVEPLGQHEVELDGAALPLAPVAVAEDEFELGSVEDAFAGLNPIVEPGASRRRCQRRLGMIPDRFRAGADRRAG
jgi:hypothetical protein